MQITSIRVLDSRVTLGAGNELFQTKVGENGLNFFVIRGHQVVTVNVTCKNTFFVFS